MMAGQWQVSRQWPVKKKRVSSTGVSLTGDLPRTRAMVPFLAPYARGGWHWFSLRATLAVLSILVGLATPALAAVAIDQAGWRIAPASVSVSVADTYANQTVTVVRPPR